VVDSERPLAPGSEQYNWLQADLDAHGSAAWRIVVVHIPPFSSSQSQVSGTSPRVLSPLFESRKVALVLSGNSHNYERSFPLVNARPVKDGGVTYVVSGGGGNGLNEFPGAQPAWSAVRAAAFQFVRVKVTPTALALECIDEGGSRIDSVVLKR
jgi:hypothetical protein